MVITIEKSQPGELWADTVFWANELWSEWHHQPLFLDTIWELCQKGATFTTD